jgi:insertion element IS1 protein InsB
MECPECNSTHIRKNGIKRGKQNHICGECGRQFIDPYEPHRGYSDEVKRNCLKMYVNGMGLRGIERVTGVHHTTVITWIKAVGEHLPDAYDPDEIPQGGELDELQTFVGSKKNKIWLWTAVDHFCKGILGWVLGDHSAETFQPLWAIACADLSVRSDLAVLFLRHGWWVSLPGVDPRGRPDCQQDLYDPSRSRSVSPWERVKTPGYGIT